MTPSLRMSGFAPETSAMSELVPPTSRVMRSSYPAAAPVVWPPITPAAGPDRNRRTGRLRAIPALASPPRDCITWSGADTPASASRCASRPR